MLESDCDRGKQDETSESCSAGCADVPSRARAGTIDGRRNLRSQRAGSHLRVEVATFVSKNGDYVEGPRVAQMEAWFNQDGNRTDLHFYDDKGVLCRRIVMKFDGPKMTEAINYDGAGKMWLRTVDVYNDKGGLKEELTYNGDASLRSKKTFKRDELGQATDVSEYNA